MREKLLTISNVHVLQCLCELVATLHAVGKLERAYSYALVAKESFALVKVILSLSRFRQSSTADYNFCFRTRVHCDKYSPFQGHPDADTLRVSFLRLASELASSLNHDPRQFDKQLSELRYQGIRVETAKPMLELIRERYIHRASHTAKLL